MNGHFYSAPRVSVHRRYKYCKLSNTVSKVLIDLINIIIVNHLEWRPLYAVNMTTGDGV